MDDDRIEASIAQGAPDTIKEAEGAIVGLLFIFFFEDEHLDKERICDIAIVNIVNNRVVIPNSYEPRFQSYLPRTTITSFATLW